MEGFVVLYKWKVKRGEMKDVIGHATIGNVQPHPILRSRILSFVEMFHFSIVVFVAAHTLRVRLGR